MDGVDRDAYLPGSVTLVNDTAAARLWPSLGSTTPRRWRLRGRFPEHALADTPYPPLVRHLLWHRGLRSAAEADAFIAGTLPDGGPDPLLLPDGGPAIDRLRRAVQDGETVAVYGDFDVDGVTASAILIESLSELGARVVPYIPDRFSEGYGLNAAAVERLRGHGVTLLVTADCGTSSIAEIEQAGKAGMDVIVIDHHTVGSTLPPALALVNPKRPDNRYPDPELASGGLAFRLMAGLYDALGREWSPERFLDLAALSTVCDVAPLRGENRWLVKEGLRALARARRPGLRALMESAGLDPRRVDAGAIGYVLGPRLNAAGRLARARLALDLLLEPDPSHATQIALRLSALNHERQQATAAALDLARELLADEDPATPLIFVGHAQIPAGIVGLVAGRLAEEYYRPAVVYERGETTSRASCRSIPEFDITAALRIRPDLLLRFGGHRAAAGFTAENDKLPALKDALLTHARQALATVDLSPVIDIDAQIPLHRVNGSLVQALARLAPFGEGNPEPVFLSRGLQVADVRLLGSEGAHLRLKLLDRDGQGQRAVWPAIAFRRGGDDVAVGDRLDVVYSFGADNLVGGLELRVIDFARPGDQTGVPGSES